MKNLKLQLAVVALLISSTGIFAQGFYITANAGYAFGMNSQLGWFANSETTIINDYVNNVYTNSRTSENVPFTLGKGMNFGVSIGYMFNDHIGIDLGINYLLGGITESSSTFSTTDKSLNGTEYYQKSKNSVKAYSRMFRIIPAIIITPGFEKFNPYVKVGVVLGFGSFQFENILESSSNNPIGPSPYSSTTKETNNGGIALGFNGTVGVDFSINERFSIFGEVSFIGMSYAPTKSVLTERTVNGIDVLPNLTTYDKETIFVNNLSNESSSSSPNPDEPSKWLKTSYPMSSLGVNFGVKFNF